jgi:isohexenylglutaconyl-CoA hydratase
MLSLAPTKNVVQSEEKSGVLFLTINRPEARNALSAELVQELTHIFDTIDSKTRAVVLRGTGGNFCAGGDIKDMAALMGGKLSDLAFADIERSKVTSYSAQIGYLLQKINNARQAVIMILEGAVLGGGMGLACVADIALALPSARFGLPETTLGLVPAQVAPFIRRKIGESYARLLAVTGAQIDAFEAQQLGLVHYVADDQDDLAQKLSDILEHIKSCAPVALATAKRLMTSIESTSFELPEQLGATFAAALNGEEAREGIAAFAERRKPKWCT